MTNAWEQQAACRGTNDPAFFPKPNPTAIDQQATERAKQICTSCPVLKTCLNYAMRMEGSAKPDYRAGIYGGLTPLERARLYARTVRRRHAIEQARAAS